MIFNEDELHQCLIILVKQLSFITLVLYKKAQKGVSLENHNEELSPLKQNS